jgi:opacity protein-like surface antigen
MLNKKFIALLVIVLMGFTSNSQVLLSILFGDKLNSDGLEFGLEGGFNWSDISGLDADKRLSTINLGFYFDFRLKNQWNIYTGVLVKAKLGDDKLSSADLEFLEITPNAEENGNYSQVLNYFVVPALLKYNFKNRMYVEAGPQFGLMYKSWVEFESDLDVKNIKTKDYNKDKINRLDTGITFGTGYKLMPDTGMTIGIKYYYGFTNVYKGVSGSNNSSLFLKVNVPIGANKKKEEPKTD